MCNNLKKTHHTGVYKYLKNYTETIYQFHATLGSFILPSERKTYTHEIKSKEKIIHVYRIVIKMIPFHT